MSINISVETRRYLLRLLFHIILLYVLLCYDRRSCIYASSGIRPSDMGGRCDPCSTCNPHSSRRTQLSGRCDRYRRAGHRRSVLRSDSLPIQDGGNIAAGLDVIEQGAYEGAKAGETMKNAGANWLISGLSYAGFVLLWFASFTAALGSKNKKKDLNYSIIGGTDAVCVAIGLIAFAQIANINTGANGTYIWNADIPNLILATKIWKPFSAIFAIVVFAGIYTTAVPLLYNPVSRFAKEGTPRFKIPQSFSAWQV